MIIACVADNQWHRLHFLAWHRKALALCLRQYLMVGLRLRFQDFNVVACVAESLAFGQSVGERRSLALEQMLKTQLFRYPRYLVGNNSPAFVQIPVPS